MGIESIPVTLLANESREVDIAGEYFEVRSAVYDLALIELMDRSGGVRGRLAGPLESDFVRPSGGFEKARITNGPTAQTVKFVYGSGDAGSRRNSGNVNVIGTVGVSGNVAMIDGNKSRTLAGGAFLWRPSSSGANINHAQLWNPAGSGKNLIVDGIILTSTLAGGLTVGRNAAQLVSASANPIQNALIGSAAASVALPRVDSNVAFQTAGTYASTLVPANGSFDFRNLLPRPIVVQPGTGLVLVAEALGAGMSGGVSFFEELV